MYYHIEFNVASIFLTLFITYYIIFKKGLRRHANRVYFVLILLNFVAEISDIVTSLGNNYPDFASGNTPAPWNYVYLVAHNAFAFVYVLYLFYLLDYEKTRKLATGLLAVPFFAEILLLFTNPFHHKIFFYNEQLVYTHGPWFGIFYVIAVGYMIFDIYLAIRHRNLLSRSKAAALIAFICISSLPIVIQIFYPEYLVTMFFETLGLMGVLFTIENKDDIINPTTGMLNRFAFQGALDSAMRSKDYTLLLLKIPNLNYYNKMIGFENMNGILGRISEWLEKEYKPYFCYDCGRGHFAVLAEKIREERIDSLKKLTFERFEKSWGREKFSLKFPIQFGVIRIPEEVKTIENVFMLIDKPFEGKESTELNVQDEISAYERRVLIEHLIDKALKNKSFQVYYQPIWDYHTGKVNSAEALCRLIDEEYGAIPPDEFIPVAEQNGTILEIGKFVFEEVCRFYQEGRLRELGIDYVEVNLSVIQCMSRGLKETFEEILNRYMVDAKCINLEVTESATASSKKLLVDTIETLNRTGFTFSLDDYGTGYSNIAYMYEMPFAIIKIDKSILWKAMDPVTGEGQRNAYLYLENTIHMLQDMNYSVLVEGVETLEQKMLLERLGCDYFQGFYFSKPVPKQVFADYLRVVNA